MNRSDLDDADEFLEAGSVREAESIYRSLLEQDPDNLQALHHLGALYCKEGRYSDALLYLSHGAERHPDDAEILHSLAVTYFVSGDLPSAERSFRACLSLAPEDAETVLSLGQVLERLGRWGDAAELYAQAANDLRDNLDLQQQAGRCFLAQGRTSDALPFLDRAGRLAPDDDEIATHLGLALQDTWHLRDAIGCLDRVLQRSPRHASAHLYMGLAHGRLGDAAASFEHLQESVILRPDPYTHSAMIRTMHYLPGMDSGRMLRDHVAWAERYAPSSSATRGRRSRCGPPWRVGFISSLFAQHASILWPFLIAGSSEFEVYCYADGFGTKTETARSLRAAMTCWRDTTNLSNEELAECIAEDCIDILFNCDGHFDFRRMPLFGARAAPIQVALSIYPGTTGVAGIDFQITDRTIDAGQDGFHSEQLVFLPSFVGFRPPAEASEVAEPLERHGKITFGSFSQPTKINAEVVRVWSRILTRVPGSHLIVHSYMPSVPGGTRQMIPDIRTRLADLFERHGISAERIHAIGYLPLREHLELYGQVDIALDPFPYNGVLTTAHALWMGVPVVTLEGQIPVARSGTSFLNALGLQGWIARTLDEYEELAVWAVKDRLLLAELRALLRNRVRNSALGDMTSFGVDFRAALCQMLGK